MPDQSLREGTSRVQMADSHLTYIGSPHPHPGGLRATCYDVYSRDGGPQLGWVFTENRGKTWIAQADQLSGEQKIARTRWQAATALWGTYPEVSGA